MMKSQKFDLEERTFRFARDVRLFIKSINSIDLIEEDIHQLLKSSGSVGANYREANDALSKKDFIYRIRISRKEAKESKYWLRLIKSMSSNIDHQGLDLLIIEAEELKRILSSILQKMETSLSK